MKSLCESTSKIQERDEVVKDAQYIFLSPKARGLVVISTTGKQPITIC